MRVWVLSVTFLVSFFFVLSGFAIAEGQVDFSTAPITNNGEKWRIGYYEGGSYSDYQNVLISLAKGLMSLGWIEKSDIPGQKGEETRNLWDWLAKDARSGYLEFVKDAYYSADWNLQTRKKISEKIISRFNNESDIDLMLAFGTWAGQDLANDRHDVPVMSHSVSDPLAAGIIKSNEDSGLDHLHARVNPFRYERQVRVFHDIMEFEKLGMAYENTPTGRSYCSIDRAEKVAQEQGFEIVSCYARGSNVDANIATEDMENDLKNCFEELCKKSDAIYVTAHGGLNTRNVSDFVKIANFHKKPTFSQFGSGAVRQGLLMSISSHSFDPLGLFHAKAIARVFNGAKPRQLEMFFESMPKIAINLKTANTIGYDPPIDVLETADEIFEEIETGDLK